MARPTIDLQEIQKNFLFEHLRNNSLWRTLMSLCSKKENGQIRSGSGVEGKAEARPPGRDAWVVDDVSVREVKDAVRNQTDDNQPGIALEPNRGYRKEDEHRR